VAKLSPQILKPIIYYTCIKIMRKMHNIDRLLTLICCTIVLYSFEHMNWFSRRTIKARVQLATPNKD